MKKITNAILFLTSLISLCGCNNSLEKQLDIIYDIMLNDDAKYESMKEVTINKKSENVVNGSKNILSEETLMYDANKMQIQINENESESYEYINESKFYVVNCNKEIYYEYDLDFSTANLWNKEVADIYLEIDTVYAIQISLLYYIEYNIKSNNELTKDEFKIKTNKKGSLDFKLENYKMDNFYYDINIKIDDYYINSISAIKKKEIGESSTYTSSIWSMEFDSNIKLPNISNFEKLKLYV